MTKIFPAKNVYHKNDEFSELRKKSGLSIDEIAKKSGKSKRTIYRYESGEIVPDKLIRDFLFGYTIKKESSSNSENNLFTFIDLFAGIGGMRKGFESVGGKCVFTSEWNKYSIQTYRENFSCDHEIAGDITKAPLDSIPDHDVLLAGFPCQPFSIAGVSKKNSLGQPHGFECETQGTLFFDIERILEYHRPRAFLLENVKNLTSHDKGRTFEVIKRTLRDKLGYFVDWRIINAKSFLPQNRERIFIVGFREDINFNFKLLHIPDPEKGPKLKSILHPEDGTEPEENPYTVGSKAKVNEKYTLSVGLWNYLQNYAIKHKAKGNGFGFGLVGENDVARTLSARYYKDGSEILVKQNGGLPRRLTPRECSRLMGFDEPKCSDFRIPVSDTQAYKQFGNAVAVPVVREVAKYMISQMYPEYYTVEVIDQLSIFDK
jgi:DNA (cytosine-5)-methyltransferase 1